MPTATLGLPALLAGYNSIYGNGNVKAILLGTGHTPSASGDVYLSNITANQLSTANGYTALVNGAGGLPVTCSVALRYSESVTQTSSGDYFTLVNHDFPDDQQIAFYEITGTTTFVAGRIYYVVNSGVNVFDISETPGGSPITIDVSGTCVTPHILDIKFGIAQWAASCAGISAGYVGYVADSGSDSTSRVLCTIKLDSQPSSAAAGTQFVQGETSFRRLIPPV